MEVLPIHVGVMIFVRIMEIAVMITGMSAGKVSMERITIIQ